MEQLSSHWTDFHDILYLVTFENLSRKVKFVCFILGNSPASEFYMPTFPTPGNPEESIQHSEHGENLESRSQVSLK
jgi:hypothetical protein